MGMTDLREQLSFGGATTPLELYRMAAARTANFATRLESEDEHRQI
jgi:hypothetical protein